MRYQRGKSLAIVLILVSSSVAAAPSRANDLTLVDNGQARCALVLGPEDASVPHALAAVLQQRIQARSGSQMPIVSKLQPSDDAGRSPITILVGTPTNNPLIARLCQSSNRLLPTPESVGPGGFVIHTEEKGKAIRIVLAGADDRGTACAVGKFFRSLDFSGRDVAVARLNIVDRIDPEETMQCQQYKPAQWRNPFVDAPSEQIREYVEDMALWGSDSLWNVCCYLINDPFAPTADEPSRQKWARIRDLFIYAHDLGMEIGYVDCPNSVYNDQLWLRKLGGKFDGRGRNEEDVCPSVPEARKIILQNRDNLYRAASEAGIELKYLLHFAYDNGGCGCDKCKPWIRTYIALSRELHQIARKYHPRVKVFFTTWYCSDAEKQVIIDYLVNEKPNWVAGVMDRPGLVGLPDQYLSSGWQTIFGCGSWECYGRMGADPMPVFLQRKIGEYHAQGIRAFFTYSEGIEDDINTAVCAQVCRHPTSTDIPAVVAEYCHAAFGTNDPDSSALAEIISTRFKTRPHGPFNASVRVEAPSDVLKQLEAIEMRMPEWGKADWRWGIVKTRVELEVLDQRAAAASDWVARFDATLAKALSKRDPALGKALDEVTRQLDRQSADFAELQKRCEQLTRRLYVDFYGTPDRNQGLSRLGMYRVSLPRQSLLAPLRRRCEALSAISNASARRQGVEALLKTLRAQVGYAADSTDMKPVLRIEGKTVIPGSWFTGGAAIALGADELFSRQATLLRPAGSRADRVRVEFDFEPGEEPLRRPIELTLRGSDPADGDTPVDILVNGASVFRGEVGLKDATASERTLPIPPGHVGKGKNRLELRNLAVSQSAATLRLDAAVLEATDFRGD